MTAMFLRDGLSYRATEAAGGPWSPSMLQGSATTALMAREVETIAQQTGFAVRRGQHAVIFGRQQVRQRGAHRRLVFDDQYAFHDHFLVGR